LCSFACATRKKEKTAERFRSYTVPDGTTDGKFPDFHDCPIWEVALATSAAPFYFPTAEVGEIKFWDGGLSNNNPIEELWLEAGSIYGDRFLVNCIVSLGTGKPDDEVKPCINYLIPSVARMHKVLENVADTERKHTSFLQRANNEGF
jgi:predicted acylesterase/phospholipase RssA